MSVRHATMGYTKLSARTAYGDATDFEFARQRFESVLRDYSQSRRALALVVLMAFQNIPNIKMTKIFPSCRAKRDILPRIGEEPDLSSACCFMRCRAPPPPRLTRWGGVTSSPPSSSLSRLLFYAMSDVYHIFVYHAQWHTQQQCDVCYYALQVV